MKCGILIEAGGQSKRMQMDKANLLIQNETFLQHLIKEFATYEQMYLSVNKEEHYPAIECVKIIDEYEKIGPLAGIVSAFHQSAVDAFFTIACDMPFMKMEVAQELFAKLVHYEGIFVEDDKHIHALGGIYTRSMLPLMEAQIQVQDYHLCHCIRQSHVRILRIEEISCCTHVFENVNTRQDYTRLFEN